MGKLFLVVLLLVGAVNCLELFVPGKPIISRRRSGRALTLEQVCTEANVGKNLCNGEGEGTDKICSATGYYQCDRTKPGEGFAMICPDDSRYCVEIDNAVKCQATPPSECVVPSDDSTFHCTGVGVYPEPTDCKKYHNCYKNPTTGDIVSQDLYCEDLYVFDPSAPKDSYCRLTNNRYCTIADCQANSFRTNVLAYQYFPKTKGQYIITCQGANQPIVSRCDAGFEADIKGFPIICTYICKGSEKAPYADDPKKYYQCTYNGSKYMPVLTDCLIPREFNPKTKVCEAVAATG